MTCGPLNELAQRFVELNLDIARRSTGVDPTSGDGEQQRRGT